MANNHEKGMAGGGGKPPLSMGMALGNNNSGGQALGGPPSGGSVFGIYEISEYTSVDLIQDEEFNFYCKFVEINNFFKGRNGKRERTNFLQQKVSESGEGHQDVVLGLFYGILADPENSNQLCQYLTMIVRDNFKFLIEAMITLIGARYQKFFLRTRRQLLWLLERVFPLNPDMSIQVLALILRYVENGKMSGFNLDPLQRVMHLMQMNIDFILTQKYYSTLFFFKLLRLVDEHSRSDQDGLRDMEISLVVKIWKEHSKSCMTIGRDLIRLLREVSGVAGFEIIWDELAQTDPNTHKPYYWGILKNTTVKNYEASKKYLAYILPPDLETMILYVFMHVKTPSFQYYVQWLFNKFIKVESCRPSIMVDIIRYAVTNFFPSNQMIASDLTPRWRLLFWSLKVIKDEYTRSILKLSIFYDAMFFSDNVDSIMNIEPAILLIKTTSSIDPELAQELIEYCLVIADYYDPQRKEVIRDSIRFFWTISVEKGVVPNLDFILENPNFRKDLKDRFFDFMQLSVKSNQIPDKSQQGPGSGNNNSNSPVPMTSVLPRPGGSMGAGVTLESQAKLPVSGGVSGGGVTDIRETTNPKSHNNNNYKVATNNGTPMDSHNITNFKGGLSEEMLIDRDDPESSEPETSPLRDDSVSSQDGDVEVSVTIPAHLELLGKDQLYEFINNPSPSTCLKSLESYLAFQKDTSQATQLREQVHKDFAVLVMNACYTTVASSYDKVQSRTTSALYQILRVSSERNDDFAFSSIIRLMSEMVRLTRRVLVELLIFTTLQENDSVRNIYVESFRKISFFVSKTQGKPIPKILVETLLASMDDLDLEVAERIVPQLCFMYGPELSANNDLFHTLLKVTSYETICLLTDHILLGSFKMIVPESVPKVMTNILTLPLINQSYSWKLVNASLEVNSDVLAESYFSSMTNLLLEVEAKNVSSGNSTTIRTNLSMLLSGLAENMHIFLSHPHFSRRHLMLVLGVPCQSQGERLTVERILKKYPLTAFKNSLVETTEPTKRAIKNLHKWLVNLGVSSRSAFSDILNDYEVKIHLEGWFKACGLDLPAITSTTINPSALH